MAMALFQVLLYSYSHKMLIQHRPVVVTAVNSVPLCQQKVTELYSVGVTVSYSWLY